jgi:aminoglycoside phosphotransferase
VSLRSGPPGGPVVLPAALARLVAGRAHEIVWHNEVGGLTVRVGHTYVKWVPAGRGIDLGAEAARLRWAVAFHPAPRVLDEGSDEDGAWLVTAALPGDNAVTARWRAQPAVTVRALGEGLRALHEALPVADCPFSWSAQERVADARRRAAAGLIDPALWHEDHQPLGLERALALLADPPPVDRLVVCQGDACAPNTLLGPDGHWTGHVDLGALGKADRWADLAVATWSTEWNYGPGWERPFLDAYGAAPDPARTAYYRLLWDLGP